MIRIGVDTGGTFTDLVRLDETGLRVHKVRSTPDDPSRAILAGVAELLGNDNEYDLVHGSTVATNAVLERKGARVALVTTRGFEDVIRIARQTRSRLYDLQVSAPRPLCDPALVFGIEERLDHHGDVVTPLDLKQIEAVAHKLIAEKAEAVAVCLLHSYANPAHEAQVLRMLREAGLVACASHQVMPEYREYERWSTTLLNAYVTPIMSRYLHTLETALGRTRLQVMQSNGGVISASQALSSPVRTVLSGPAAGVVGAQMLARASGHERVILFDMGGTSTDVSLVDRALSYTSESSVGDFPVRLPMLDIHTVGAGGGSIAYVDSGGSLRVGPKSAGADPGPVCYGKGEELTVSDANLLLGRLPAQHFLGGRMQLDVERTRIRAAEFAAKLGITPERLAEGIIQIANANMEHAIRAVSVQRGHDPRDFALLAFGGAGGMHACEIAAAMEIETVLVPRHAGVLSALGMLLADVRKDYAKTILRPSTELNETVLAAHFAPLLTQARAELEREGFSANDIELATLLDVRYRGQAYEISVPASPGFKQEFHRQHETLYGYSSPALPLEVVNLRVNATGRTRKFAFPTPEIAAQPLPQTLATAQTYFSGRWLETPIYRREELLPGVSGHGPAVLAGDQATIVIPPSFRFTIDGLDTLVATHECAKETGPATESENA